MDDLMYTNLISTFFVKKKLIYERSERLEKCYEYVAKHVDVNSSKEIPTIQKAIGSVEMTFMKKWRALKCKTEELFNETYNDWIHLTLKLPPPTETNTPTGRPKISGFDNLSERSKNRRAAELTECELPMLLLASAQAAKKLGYRDMDHVLRLLYNDREMATKICVLLQAEKMLVKKPKPVQATPLRGLTHLLDNRFSKGQYTTTRLFAKECGSDIFPSYTKVSAAKKECRPPADCLTINDVCAALPLQALLDHTAFRLLMLQEEVIKALENDEITVKLQAKWGSDGSSDQSRFNQKYVESTESSDANLFATTLVPLRMTTDCHKIIWNNATPNSCRWCRPLRLQFAKETPELTLEEIRSVEEQIRLLTPYTTTIANKKITVTYDLYLTMIDGKVHSVVTHTKSSLVCTICGGCPKQFNNLQDLEIRFKPKEGTLKYGVSVLHFWIRSFEWLLHISYRITEEKWQMRGPVLKKVVKDRKLLLQARFWDKMKLRVSFPSKQGTGNSNSGPVARMAFSRPEDLAEILELEVELIKRVSIIIVALSSQFPLDPYLFPAFCKETAHYYVSKYKWFPMPQSVHTVLIHARDLILANDLPLGVLAEDAAESCNKLYRHNRQFHARNVSRKQNLMDVFNRALDTSDPLVSSFSLQKRLNSRQRKGLPTEVLRLLQAPNAPGSAIEVDERLLQENDDDEFDDPLHEISESLEELSLPEDPMYSVDDDDDEDEDDEEILYAFANMSDYDGDDDDDNGDDDVDDNDDEESFCNGGDVSDADDDEGFEGF